MDCLLEDMPLAPDNQGWVKNEINEAIAKAIAPLRPPSGWRKALHTLREWGVLGVTITIIITLIGLLLVQWNAANKRLAEEARFEEKTGNHLDKIDERLRVLTVSSAGSTPNNPASQAQARDIIAETEKNPAKRLPEPIVQIVGTQFIEASSNDPGAWNVGLDFLAYRSRFNASLLQVGTAEQIATTPAFNEGPSARFFNAPPGYPGPNFSASVSRDQSALLGLLEVGIPGNPPPGIGRGKQVILGEGGAILLDGMIMRHVVLRKTAVFYNGGDTSLEDVIFVDCTFVLKNEPAARLFALAVLGQSQVRFQPTKQ